MLRLLLLASLLISQILPAQTTVCKKDGKYGLCNGNKELVPAKYDFIRYYVINDIPHYLYISGSKVVKKPMSDTEVYDFKGSDDENWITEKDYSVDEFVYIKDAVFGLADSNGKTILAQEYSLIYPYWGFWLVQKNGKYGLAKKSGELRIPIEYNLIEPFFYDGSEIHLGYITHKGGRIEIQERLDSQYTLDPNTEEMLIVQSKVKHEVYKGGTFGLLDTAGNSLIADADRFCYYQSILSYETERTEFFRVDMSEDVPVRHIGRVGFYNFARAPLMLRVKGKWIHVLPSGKPFLQTGIDSFQIVRWRDTNNLRIWHDGKCGLFTGSGKEILPVKFNYIQQPVIYDYYDNDTLRIKGIVLTETEGETTVRDLELKPLQSYKRSRLLCRYLSDSVYIFIEKGRSGLINLAGKVLVPARYDYIEAHDLGFTAYKNPDKPGKATWNNFAGEINYENYSWHFMNDSSSMAFYSKAGKLMLDFTKYDCSFRRDLNFVDEANELRYVTWYQVSKGNKTGIVDDEGRIVIPLKYSDISIKEIKDLLFILYKGEKCGLGNRKGKEIIPVIYNEFYFLDRNGNEGTPAGSNCVIASMGGKRVMGKRRVNTEWDIYTGLPMMTEIDGWVFPGQKYYLVQFDGKQSAGPYDTIISMGFTYESRLPGKACYFFAKGGRYGLLDMNGKVITQPVHEKIYMDNSLIIIEQNGKAGMLGEDGKLLIPCEYEPGKIHKVYGREDHYDARRPGGKLGILDSTGKEVTPFNFETVWHYDSYDSEYDYIKHFIVLGDTGELRYLYSLANRKMLMESGISATAKAFGNCFYLNVGGKQTYISYSEKKLEGGKWGLASTDGRLLIPVEYDRISMFNTEAQLYLAVKYGKTPVKDFYDSLGNPVPNGDERWKKTLIGSLAKPRAEKQYKWGSPSGPEGADVTALCIDKKGNYWLGTGSSGGVYFSSDKGTTWKEKNKGISPVDVQILRFRKDTLWLVYAENGYEEQDEIKYSFYDNDHHLAWFNASAMTWKTLKGDEYNSDILHELYDSTIIEKSRFEGELNWIGESQLPAKRYLSGYEFHEANDYGNLVVSDEAGKKISGFPLDLFNNNSATLIPNGKGAFLLSKSGLYKYDGASKVIRMPQTGLHAADITQLLRMPDKSGYFALSGISDIWFYSTTGWKKILDAHAVHAKENSVSSVGFATHALRMQPDGKILFLFNGNICEMDKDGNRKILMSPPDPVKKDEVEKIYIPLCAVKDPNDPSSLIGIMVSETWKSRTQKEEHHKYNVFRYHTQTKKLDYLSDTAIHSSDYAPGIIPIIVSDPSGRVWIATPENLFRLDSNGKIALMLKANTFFKTEGLTFGSDGTGILADGQGYLMYYDPKKDNWYRLLQTEHHVPEKFGFDETGNIYASFNFQFNYGCGGKYAIGVPGFYRLSFSDAGPEFIRIPDGPNPRILSMAPHPKGLLVGTSGSGAVVLEIK